MMDRPVEIGRGTGSDRTITLRERLARFGLRRPRDRRRTRSAWWLGWSSCRPKFRGRFVVLIANDITHKAGSFGVREDRFFQRCASFARRGGGLPFVYISSILARVGMVDNLEAAVRPISLRMY